MSCAVTLPRFLRHLVAARAADPRSDGELLAAFAHRRDGDAFSILVTRHGPLVWGACCRLLGDANDAEDAFQATFLVLARRAATLADHASLTGWLYVVARRVVQDMRKSSRRRRQREQRASTMRSTATDSVVPYLGAELDEALAELPEKYRKPLLLCYLQGKTQTEAAQQLGCAVSSVSRHLARGCELLRARLSQRGVVIAAAAVAPALAQAAAQAAMPLHCVPATTAAALAFTGGGAVNTVAAQMAQSMIQSLWLTKLKAWGLLLAALIGTSFGAGVGLGCLCLQAPSAVTNNASSEEKPRQALAPPHDLYGDPLPEGALARIGTVRFRPGQEGGESHVAIAPDNRTLWSVHGRDQVCAWNLATGRVQRSLEGPSNGYGIALSSDGKRLAVSGLKELWVWDLTTAPPAVLWKQQPKGLGCGEVAFSPDGKMLACGGDPVHAIVLLDATTGGLLQTLDGCGYKLLFSADGKCLASWDRTEKIFLWDVSTGKKRYTLGSREEGGGKTVYVVNSFSFSPDSKTLAASRLVIRNAESAKDKRLPRDFEREILLWDVATGQKRSLTENAGRGGSVVFSSDGQTLLELADGHIRSWDWFNGKEGKPPLSIPSLRDAATLSHDGKWLISANACAIQAWHAETGQPVLSEEAPSQPLLSVAVSPDGNKVTTATRSELMVWDADSGKPRRRLPLGVVSPKVSFLIQDVCPCNQTLLVSKMTHFQERGPEFSLSGWDLDTGAPEALPSMPATQHSFAASADGRLIALAEAERVTLFDRATGQALKTLADQTGSTRLLFSLDGRTLASWSSTTRNIAIWNTETGKHQATCQVQNPPAGNWSQRPFFALSPDGQILAIGEYESKSRRAFIRLRHAVSGAEIQRLVGPANIICSLAFSADGRMLVSGDADGTVRVWEVASAGMRLEFAGHRSTVSCAAFFPDGRRLVTGSADSTALIWDLEPALPEKGKAHPLDSDAAIWKALGSPDAEWAYRAIWSLVKTPETAVPLLRERLQPQPVPDSKQVTRWLAELDDDKFEVRKQALTALEEQGLAVEAALRQALKDSPSAEVQRQIKDLLERLESLRSSAALTARRSVEVLERIDNPSARRLLEELAKRPVGSFQASEAQAALRRLMKQAPSSP